MLKSRSLEHEYIDSIDCSEKIVRQTHKFLRYFNNSLGGINVINSFLDFAVPSDNCLNILDIGSGTCDIPLKIAQLASHRNIAVNLTCIEKDKLAYELGKQAVQSSRFTNIRLVNADIFEYTPDASFDYAFTSLFFHHFSDEQIILLINHLRTFVRKGLFISDLCRSPLSLALSPLLLPFTGKSVYHDVQISIKKGFKKIELQQMLQKIENVKVVIQKNPYGRIMAKLNFLGGF